MYNLYTPYEKVRLRHALVHAVTAYDRRQMRSAYHNPNALAMYFAAVDRAMAHVEGGMYAGPALREEFVDRLLTRLEKEAAAVVGADRMGG